MEKKLCNLLEGHEHLTIPPSMGLSQGVYIWVVQWEGSDLPFHFGVLESVLIPDNCLDKSLQFP